MLIVNYSEKSLVVDILSQSFDTNKSVNYVVKQDKRRHDRIRKLMEYAFDLCYQFGEIYMSKDKKGCALTLHPDKKRTTLKTILLDAKLAYSCIGLSRIVKVLERESVIKSYYPSHPFLYLWFIGVIPSDQRRGTGRRLLNYLINKSEMQNRPIYLETSSKENVGFYKKFEFEIYKEIESPLQLFLLRKNPALRK